MDGGLEEMLRGLLFNQQPMQDQQQAQLAGGAPPPMTFGDRFSPAAGMPAAQDVSLPPNASPTAGTLPPPSQKGGVFGAMPGWAPDERPMGYAEQPLQRSRPDLPAEITNGPDPMPTAVPMPQPRPGAAIIKDPSNPLGGTPYGGEIVPPPSAPPPGPPLSLAPPSPQPTAAPGGGLLSALGGGKMLARSLASGLMNVKNSPFAGEVFAHGMGGAMHGGNQYQDAQDAAKAAALTQALKAKQNEQTNAYHMGQLDVAHGNLGVNQANSASLADLRKAQAARPGAWNKTPHQIRLDVDKLLIEQGKEIDRKYAGEMNREQRAANAVKAAAEKAALKEQAYKQYGIDPNAPSGGAHGGTPGAPVTTREQYDALPPGARYQHPSDPPGQLRVKGGGGAAPAPVVPLGAGGEEDEDQ